MAEQKRDKMPQQKFLTDEIETKAPKKPTIYIDSRETKLFDEILKKEGAEVKRKMLEVGDFICSSRLIVERKTRSDFEQSIVDGRLFVQLGDLKVNYERFVVIVEGESSEGRIKKGALLGAYASIISDYGAALFFTRNIRKTAELIYSLAKHEQIGKKITVRIYAKRRTLTPSQTSRSIIEMLPMVGPKLATALLKHFGNVENIVNASEQELLEVEGLGSKRAKLIRSIIKHIYNEKEDKQ